MSATQEKAATTTELGSPPVATAARRDAAIPDRTLALLASDGVAYLLYWMVILVLLSQAITSFLRAPEESVGSGVLSGLVCLVWAAFCLGMGVLRADATDGTDRPPPVWLPVVTAASCLLSLRLMREATGQAGPWPAEIVVGGLLVAGVTVWRNGLVGGLTGLALVAILIVAPLAAGAEQGTLATPLSGVTAGVALIAASFAVALALGWLRRSADRLQASLDARDELLVREAAVREAAEVAAEIERSLHDTALNTLETIAAHGQHLAPDLVIARCAADVEQLSRWRSEAGMRALGDVIERLTAHADRLGLELRLHQAAGGGPSRVRVPPPVLHAFAGAASEALTNVAKHSAVRQATVLIDHDEDSLRILVVDEGVGLGVSRQGFGVVRSVQERMVSVGGTSSVGPGPEGVGTVVELAWQPVPDAIPDIGSDLLLRVARVVLGIGTLLAGISCALVVLAWPAYVHPAAALVGPVASVLVAAWILQDAGAGRPITASHVLASCATYILVGAAAVLADPYCSSVLGEGVVLDARAPLMVIVILVAPRPGVVAAVLGTVGLAHIFGALTWNAHWAGCGPDTAEAGVYVVATVGAIWLFVRRIDRVASEYARARVQVNQAEVRIRAQITIRAEEELWVSETLAAAQDLLACIAAGRLDPAAPATRATCAAEAQFLRALLSAGRAPEDLRRPARIWLRVLHAAGCRVQVRGAFPPDCPPGRTIGQVGGVLDTIALMAPGATVTLSVWSDPEQGSLTVSAQGPGIAAQAWPLERRVQRVAQEAWREVDGDCLTVEWTWPRLDGAEPAASR